MNKYFSLIKHQARQHLQRVIGIFYRTLLRRLNSLFYPAAMIICLFLVVVCQPTTDVQRRACSIENKIEFSLCMENLYPPGSDYSELEAFLYGKGLNKDLLSQNASKNRFYFFWKPNGLNLANYRIVVTGEYDDNLKLKTVDVG